MVAGLILGKKGSIGFPGKNLHPILGRPLAWYPMQTALRSEHLDRLFLSTDDPRLMSLAQKIRFEHKSVDIIERPPHLCTPTALGEDAYVHGYQEMSRRLGSKPDLLALFFCNAATFTVAQLDEAITALRKDPSLDSAVTVSRYNMWSPLRARRRSSAGILEPFVPLETFGDPKTLNCDRDSQGDVLYTDVSVCVIRPGNFDQIESGLLPQRWMGKRIYPIANEAGLDVDYEWQFPQVDWWLRKRGGFTDASSDESRFLQT